jgi:3-hydroxyisobutyrate dehydrogenase
MCDIAIVLVVDAAQVDDVLFGAGGAANALRPGAIAVLSSTVAPDYVSVLSGRLKTHGVTLVDAPVSGGPQRARQGSMTMMVAGDASSLARCEPVFAAMAGRVFSVGSAPGDAAKFKVVNNLLAAVNLAAGAEALARRPRRPRPRQVVEVVNASSGASWIFADRMRARSPAISPARRGGSSPRMWNRRGIRRAPRRRCDVRERRTRRVPRTGRRRLRRRG